MPELWITFVARANWLLKPPMSFAIFLRAKRARKLQSMAGIN